MKNEELYVDQLRVCCTDLVAHPRRIVIQRPDRKKTSSVTVETHHAADVGSALTGVATSATAAVKIPFLADFPSTSAK